MWGGNEVAGVGKKVFLAHNSKGELVMNALAWQIHTIFNASYL
jgi:hypothetical protein